MMIRGRHRGLPYALDRAITLPSDRTNNEEETQRYRDKEIGDKKQKVGVEKEE
jgi:hypothetical protein